MVETFEYVQRWAADREVKGWWHSFELPDGSRVEGVCSLEGLRNRLAQFPIPSDLRGKRALDIGTWDGFFAFELERRGATVVAIDNWDNPRFHQMHALMNSQVEYRQLDMYELTPDRIGYFDIVLFMGVLYHLKHPLLGLERVCALTTDLAAVDSFVLREEHRPGVNVESRPVMEFYETTEFGGQTDNWVGPTLPCLLAMCRTAGFARVLPQKVLDESACVACYRTWDAPVPGAPAGPELVSAFHVRDYGINFQSRYDEYVGVTVVTSDSELTLDDVKPEVGGYGVRPIELGRVSADQIQIGFKLPPGLKPGMHDVSVRLRDSAAGPAKHIAVDMPVEAPDLAITRVTDGTSWKPDELEINKCEVLSVWLLGLPENADGNNLQAYLNSKRMHVQYIDPPGRADRQVNLMAPRDAYPSSATLRIEVGGQVVSRTIRITV